MYRSLRLALPLCALLAAVPAAADTTDVHILRAQEILSRMISIIDGIQARKTALPAVLAQAPGAWRSLFDGKTMGNWTRTDFGGGGAVRIEAGFRGGPAAIVVDAGSTLSGFNWTGDMPKTNYEVALEAMKVKGEDFFCGLTFPVADSHASLILGGWGGTVVGISSIDGANASENETTSSIIFPADRWYKIRMRVTPDKLEAWLDEKQVINVSIKDRTITLRRGEIDKSVPLGISTYQTSAAFRDIRLRRLEGK